MNNKIIYIKLKEGCEPIKHFEDSYLLNSGNKNHSVSYYYNINKDDECKIISDIKIDENCYLIALIYDCDEIKNAYLGTGILHHNEKGYSLKLSIITELPQCTAIKNICKLSELDLDSDFDRKEYLTIENSELISNQIDFIINMPLEEPYKERDYEEFTSESNLHALAQKNEYCRRQFNLREPMEFRGEFQRDYERIIHSKAFRRMVDKAQVFSASKGDYYRTRMTHSQAVSQIACAISEGLNLNLHLTEAIALGHDIGHTPFGHQGERTLDEILRGKYNIIENIDLYKDSFGGFKHNYQSIRVATSLEEKYSEIYGMDLSFQTLEGMLKHTKLKRDKFLLDQFICSDKAYDELHFDQDFCSTLEGQVVSIADEIAQRGHDLDDAFSSGSMTIEEFKKLLGIKKMTILTNIVEDVNSNIKDMIENHHRFIDENELRKSRIVSIIVSYFINDVIDNSKTLMDQYDVEQFKSDGYSVTKCLVNFSEEATQLNKYLETIIANKVINNSEVSLFDSNAATIVRSLFKAYYNNPRLLHKGTQRRIYIDIRKKGLNNVIDFEYGNHKIIKKEFDLITKDDLEKIKNSNIKEEYKLKRWVLVRNICDFISGMTDTYAINEYNRIAKNI